MAEYSVKIIRPKKGFVKHYQRPTPTHYILGHLGREGLIHGWVQQNHDGLPQKAGFPQEKINEIHGSWFDPSNPVVKYDGSLHPRAFPWMKKDASTADLVLVLGTSLSGLTADCVATLPAGRSEYWSTERELFPSCQNAKREQQQFFKN